MRPVSSALGSVLIVAVLIVARSASCFAQADPASEPAVLAVAKVLPTVVNINTERVVRRTVRDPFEDVYAQFSRLCKVSAQVSLSIRVATSLPTSTWSSAPQT